MSEFYALPRRPPRVWQFIDDIKTRLAASSALVTALGGAGRIYKSTENYSQAPAGASETTLWTRLVILPVTTLWQTSETPAQDRMIPFVVRAELHAPSDPNYDSSRKLEALHEEVFMQLHGWRPGDRPYYRVQSEVYRSLMPQTQPEFDESRGLWLNSAQYKAHVLPPIS